MEIAGRIKNIQGSERSQRKIIVPRGAIRLDLGDPDFPTPPHIQEAAFKAMRDNFTHYGNALGEEDLREAICYRLYQDLAVRKSPENVLITVGGIEAINTICATYLNPGDEVIVFDPGYSAYAVSAVLFEGCAIAVPLLDDFHIDFDILKKKISSRTKIIFLANPSNPTATVLHPEEVINLTQIAQAHDLMLVVDEVYHKLIYEGHKHFSICQVEEAKDHTILLNSFSKTYAMTGWRVGYVVAEPKIINSLVHFHRAMVSCVSVPAQKACIAALLGPQDCVTQMVAQFDQRRKLVATELNKIDRLTYYPCAGAFYFFPKFAHHLSSKEMADYLLRQGILVRSGTEFGAQGEKHIRLSFATSLADLSEGLARLKKAFDELPS